LNTTGKTRKKHQEQKVEPFNKNIQQFPYHQNGLSFSNKTGKYKFIRMNKQLFQVKDKN
jgi:hypothetical protein